MGRAQWGEEGEVGERWRQGREDRVPRLQNLLCQAFIFLPSSLWLLATFLIPQCLSWYRPSFLSLEEVAGGDRLSEWDLRSSASPGTLAGS